MTEEANGPLPPLGACYQRNASEESGSGIGAAGESRLEVASVSGSAQAFHDTIEGISVRLDELQALFEAKILDDEQRHDWVGELVSEMQSARKEFVFESVLSRIFRDLFVFYDTVGQTLDVLEQRSISEHAIAARLANLQRQVLKMLTREGVEPIESDLQSGSRFNEEEQEVIGVRPVSDPGREGLILESARCGFRYGQRILRPESVIVGTYSIA